MEESLLSSEAKQHIAALIDMGVEARKKGDLSRARRMFRVAIRKSMSCANSKAHVIRIAISVANTYLDETNYNLAEAWYKHALNLSLALYGDCNMQVACLLVKLAELNTLQGKFNEHRTLFERAQKVYLLSKSADVRVFRNCLIDLSWSLCVMNEASSAREVNQLIDQIEQTEKLGAEQFYDKARNNFDVNSLR